MESYTKFAVRGAATILVISLIAAILGYVVRVLLARNLEVEEFGLFYAVFAFVWIPVYMVNSICIKAAASSY